MLNRRQFITAGLGATASVAALAGCSGGGTSAGGSGSAPAGGTGKVYYLNFKPEQDPQW